MHRHSWPETTVGPLTLLDGGPTEVVEAFRELANVLPGHDAHRVTAEAHVASLLHLDDPNYVQAFNQSRLRYADGNAVALVARLGGAQRIRRAVTTDVAWDFLHVMRTDRKRLPRVAVVGGPPGLAESALSALVDEGAAQAAGSCHGFHREWHDQVARLAAAEPDLLFVGMGTPIEATWSQRYVADVPGALLVPCGGWFGYLVGDERRAPPSVRRLGLEWAFRVSQDPRRLGPRYVRGAWATSTLALRQVLRGSHDGHQNSSGPPAGQ